MKKIFLVLTFASVQMLANAPMSSSHAKASEKCPQMLKGYEAAKKLTLPAEQKEKMLTINFLYELNFCMAVSYIIYNQHKQD